MIGPESTGKSTLSAALAAALHTVWVPEYAREYLENLGRPYEEHDLLAIARGQLRSEDELALQASNYLICDTDLNVIKVWSENSYGSCHKDVLEEIARRKYDLYLLTDIDIPWEDDPLREHATPELRNYFYCQYKDMVMNSGIPWANISCNHEERLNKSLNIIAQLLNG